MQTINISTSTIFRFLLIILAIVFIFYIADILLLIFISFVLVSAIYPVVDKMEKYKIPRSVSAVFIYLVIIFGLGYAIALLVQPLIGQLSQLIQHLPDYWNNLVANSWLKHFVIQNPSSDDIYHIVGSNLSNNFLANGFFFKAGSLFMKLIYFVVIFSLAFYMTIQKNALEKLIKAIAPEEHQKYIISLVTRIQDKMGKWLLGQLFLNLIIGSAAYLLLFLLKVPFALILALVAAVLEFIPNIGPTIAAVIAAVIALTVNPVNAILVIIGFIVIQQIENHLIVPLVMKQAVGLNPVVVIVALLIGAKLGGPLGAVMAVPVTTAFSVFIGDLFEKSEA